MRNQQPEYLCELLDRHGPALALYAKTWCDCPDDVVQNALLKLVSLSSEPDDALAWLYRAVRNAAISARRATKRRRRYEAEAASQGRRWFRSSVAERLDAQTVADGLKRLPEPEREVMVARIWGGLTFQQIAEVAGCSSSTAHRRYATGLAMLRERIDTTSCPTSNRTDPG